MTDLLSLAADFDFKRNLFLAQLDRIGRKNDVTMVDFALLRASAGSLALSHMDLFGAIGADVARLTGSDELPAADPFEIASLLRECTLERSRSSAIDLRALA